MTPLGHAVPGAERPMIDYAPFSGDDTTCPKCGGRMAKRYQDANTVYVSRGLVCISRGPEWLLRQCLDCDYDWPELCADAAQPVT